MFSISLSFITFRIEQYIDIFFYNIEHSQLLTTHPQSMEEGSYTRMPPEGQRVPHSSDCTCQYLSGLSVWSGSQEGSSGAGQRQGGGEGRSSGPPSATVGRHGSRCRVSRILRTPPLSRSSPVRPRVYVSKSPTLSQSYWERSEDKFAMSLLPGRSL